MIQQNRAGDPASWVPQAEPFATTTRWCRLSNNAIAQVAWPVPDQGWNG
jgi:hypothetical protein